jgi:hypothetical protein
MRDLELVPVIEQGPAERAGLPVAQVVSADLRPVRRVDWTSKLRGGKHPEARRIRQHSRQLGEVDEGQWTRFTRRPVLEVTGNRERQKWGSAPCAWRTVAEAFSESVTELHLDGADAEPAAT